MVMQKKPITIDRELLTEVSKIVKEDQDLLNEIKLKLKDCRNTLKESKTLDTAQRMLLQVIASKGGAI